MGELFLKDSDILSQEGYLTAGDDRFLFVLVKTVRLTRALSSMLYLCSFAQTISEMCNMTFPMSRPG